MPIAGTFAALASVPARALFLSQVLPSLREQVDTLAVYLNGYTSVPDAVHEHADEFVLSEENLGGERKFHWSERHQGIYLTCDDDLVYPPDYVRSMVRTVEQFEGQAIVTAHGRSFEGQPKAFHLAKAGTIGMFHRRVDAGRPCNHGGTGVMAWDTRRVHVPSGWEHRNLCDMQLAVWAQRHRVPMWQLPHPANWFGNLAMTDPRGIYASSRREGHARRNRMLAEQGARSPWTTFPLRDPTA